MIDTELGDSIAVSGVCLTAVELGEQYFVADVSNETLARTTLKSSVVGSAVNLELALTPSSRMGGHFVSGHVDGIGAIIEKTKDARSVQFAIQSPEGLSKYIAEKGSICMDGISLTVNHVDSEIFTVNIVPHTLQHTTLGHAVVGDKLNLEVDLLARYLERLMQGETAKSAAGGVTQELLQNSGFFK